MDAVKTFIQERVKTLGIRKSDLVRRLGFKNLNGGMRALELYEEGWHSHPFLKNKMHIALEVTPEEFAAVQNRDIQVIKELEAEREAAWEAERRQNFRPYLFAELEAPIPIFSMMARAYFENLRYAYLPTYFNEMPVVEQESAIKEAIHSRMVKYKGIGRSFDSILYFILRRSYDEPVKDRQIYDLEGNKRDNSSLDDKNSATASVS